jgi:hypothetical protein
MIKINRMANYATQVIVGSTLPYRIARMNIKKNKKPNQLCQSRTFGNHDEIVCKGKNNTDILHPNVVNVPSYDII